MPVGLTEDLPSGKCGTRGSVVTLRACAVFSFLQSLSPVSIPDYSFHVRFFKMSVSEQNKVSKYSTLNLLSAGQFAKRKTVSSSTSQSGQVVGTAGFTLWR